MRFQSLFFLALTLCLSSLSYAKRALLVGVSKYEHPRLNDTQLKFPEDDANAIADVLKASGYEVQLLVGKQATQQAIQTAMSQLARKASGDDVLILGFFGHGVQYGESAFYCPYDTDLRVVTDADGKALRDNAGVLRQEPDPAKMVSMRDMLDVLTISKAGSKLLMADCCREDPSRARGGLRGRAFGSALRVDQLPKNCAAMFACSEGEQAFEHDDWKHGAFTRALLNSLTKQARITANGLSESVYLEVETLVNAKGGSQRVKSLLTGGLVDLKLRVDRKVEPAMEGKPTQSITLIPAPTAESNSPPSYINSVGAKMILMPAGTFMMGSPKSEKLDDIFGDSTSSTSGNDDLFGDSTSSTSVEDDLFGDSTSIASGDDDLFGDVSSDDEESQHRVTLSRSFYIGEAEVTQGQWKAVMGTEPWKGNKNVKEGTNYPATYVNWDEANEYCRRLGQREGRTYRLPTEAEWEYACRGGKSTEYSFGDDPASLDRYAWFEDNANNTTEAYPHEVKQKLANSFGLYDMHGNVWEWCKDRYGKYSSGASVDPDGPTNGEYRVDRGGSWNSAACDCNSTLRRWGTPMFRSNFLGFRLVSVSQ